MTPPELVEAAPAGCRPPAGPSLDWLDPAPGPLAGEPEPLEPEPPAGLVLELPTPLVPPAGLVLPAEFGGGAVVVVVVLVLLVVELVGGSVVVVGGSVVVGGRVVLGGRRAGRLDDGGAAVVVVARRLGGRVACWRLVVPGGLVEVTWETASRAGRVVVVVVVPWAVATGPGEVRKPTRLPPIAPISIAVTTLTQRRSATKEIGPNLDPPGSSSLSPMIGARARLRSNIFEQTLSSAPPPPRGTMGAAAGAASAGASRRAS